MSTHWQPGSSDLPASGVTAGTYGDATHVGQVTVAASGLVTAASNVAITGGGGGGGGSEIGYDQVTTGTITVTATTEGSPTTLVAASAYTFDGAAVLLHFYCPRISNPSSGNMTVVLFESGSSLGRLGFTPSSVTLGLAFFYRFTPSAGSHTYTIAAYGTVGNGSFIQGAAGANTEVPMFVRFTKV